MLSWVRKGFVSHSPLPPPLVRCSATWTPASPGVTACSPVPLGEGPGVRVVAPAPIAVAPPPRTLAGDGAHPSHPVHPAHPCETPDTRPFRGRAPAAYAGQWRRGGVGSLPRLGVGVTGVKWRLMAHFGAPGTTPAARCTPVGEPCRSGRGVTALAARGQRRLRLRAARPATATRRGRVRWRALRTSAFAGVTGRRPTPDRYPLH